MEKNHEILELLETLEIADLLEIKEFINNILVKKAVELSGKESPILDIDISKENNLSPRTKRVLRFANIKTLREINAMGIRQLKTIPGVGAGVIKELSEELARWGQHLS